MHTGRLALGLVTAVIGAGALAGPETSSPVISAAAATPTASPTAASPLARTGPRCFGAASRDPLAPCRNRALRLRVTPTPARAQRAPNAACPELGQIAGKRMCGFGVAPTQATRTVALVGDSHAGMWRGPLDRAARVLGWTGIGIGHASCPLSTALRDLPEPNRSHCARWKRGVFAWFEHRPDVSALFMSELSGGSGVVATNGRSQFETAVAGYRAAWRRLPGTVKHVIVIRDTPKAEPWTLDCVDRARRAHKPAGPVCVNRRTEALDADPAAVAARREHGRRVQLLDLTRIFCGPRVCYPVIGGALVHKDTTHLTATFGEPLLRRLEPLTRAWQE